MKPIPSIELLLDLIDQSYDRRAWHGTNLRGSIRGLAAKQAAWRPDTGRHNIWEIVVHVAYWKYTVRRRLLGEKRGSFPLDGSNWFERPLKMSESAWKADIQLLEETHKSMRKSIAAIPLDELYNLSPGSKWTNAQLVYGISSHDLYHTGQIQQLKRLRKRG